MKTFSKFILASLTALLLTGCAGPLHTAAENNDLDEINRLLDQGADVNALSLGSTPLWNASFRGRLEAASLLIDRGARVESVHLWGAAFGTDDEELARLLIKNGADLTFAWEGKNALDHAQARNHMKIYRAIIQALKDKEQAKRDAQIAALEEQKRQVQLREAQTVNSLIAKNDIAGLIAYVELHPESVAYIQNLRVRLLITGPAGLRIIDILQQIQNKRNESIIIARIKGVTGAYKNFNDNELNELIAMGISEEIIAAMITVTNEYYKEKKRLAEQQSIIASQQKAAEEKARQAQQMQEQERIRQQQAAAKSDDFQWGKAAALLGGSMIGGLDKLSSEAQTQVFTGILQDSMGGQEGVSNLAAVTNTQTSINETAGGYNNVQTPVLAAQASRSNDTLWHDDYSNTVTKTGETKSYPNHERNIPGSYIVKVKDRASAEAVWSNQGGKVIDYYGSIDSGKITVIVDFGYIKDTHVYVRDK